MMDSMTPVTRTRPRAFSLIELLVVIAILGVLAALLFPTLTNVMGVQKSVVCTTKLRQIGTAVQSYAVDHEGMIVPSVSEQGISWWASLAPYLGAKAVGEPLPGDPETSVYMCPVEKRNHDGNGATEYRIGKYVTRYNINYHIAAFETAIVNGGVFSVFRRTRMAQIAEPSKTFLAGDLFGNGGGAYWMTSDGELTYPHNGKVNILFLDNHVEGIGPERMLELGSQPFHVFWKGYDWGYPGYATD